MKKMTMNLLSVFAFISIFFLEASNHQLRPSIAYAAANSFEDLLASDERPTVEDVVKLLGPQQLAQGILPARGARGIDRQVRADIIQNFPAIIALLEANFPNGVYATLGRDAYHIADILEGFYLAQGIRGRVVRLGASTATVSSMNSQQMAEFLISHGLDLQAAAAGTKPFLIIDRTSYGPNSQSTQLIAAAYARASAVQRPKLFGQVMALSSNNGLALDRNNSAQRYVQSGQLGDPQTASRPAYAFHIPSLRAYTDNMDTTWSSTFGAYGYRTRDGRLSGRPGSEEGNRGHALNLFADLYRLGQDPTFVEAVYAAGATLGLDLRARFRAASQPPISALDQQRAQGRQTYLNELVAAVVDARLGILRSAIHNDFINQYIQSLESRLMREATEAIGDLSATNKQKIDRTVRGLQREADLALRVYDMQTTFGRMLFEESLTVPPIVAGDSSDDVHDGKYFSPERGRVIHHFIENYFQANGNQISAEEALDILRFCDLAQAQGVITSRDTRRLILYVFHWWNTPLSNQDLQSLQAFLDNSQVVKQTLMERSEVYLTSERNDSVGRTFYQNLVQNGIIPPPPKAQANDAEGGEQCAGNFKKPARKKKS